MINLHTKHLKHSQMQDLLWHWTLVPEFAVAQSGQEANQLNRFAKTHLISENAARLLAVQLPQPPDARLLISGLRLKINQMIKY